MASCKDCVHVEACSRKQKIVIDGLNRAAQYAEKFTNEKIEVGCSKEESLCELFCDRSRFVELPCKVGDTIFILLKSQDILEYKVFYINIFRGEVYDYINIVLDRNYHRIEFTEGRFKYELGKTVFLTREEAEQALKEREENAN